MFNLAIDSKLRGCDLVALRVGDVAPNGYAKDRANVRQQKTGRPVRFELTEPTRDAVDSYLRMTNRKVGEYLFPGGRNPDRPLCTRPYARLVSKWVGGIGLATGNFARRSLARLIYRRTGNRRAVIVSYLGDCKLSRGLSRQAADVLASALRCHPG